MIRKIITVFYDAFLDMINVMKSEIRNGRDIQRLLLVCFKIVVLLLTIIVIPFMVLQKGFEWCVSHSSELLLMGIIIWVLYDTWNEKVIKARCVKSEEIWSELAHRVVMPALRKSGVTIMNDFELEYVGEQDRKYYYFALPVGFEEEQKTILHGRLIRSLSQMRKISEKEVVKNNYIQICSKFIKISM